MASKKFSFGAMRALLTYKTHLNKEDFIKWFKNKIYIPCEFIRLAHENGEGEEEETPYEHTHVVFKLESRFQTTNERFFDYEEKHPHIRTLKNEKALKDAKKYISKEDPENKDLLEEENLVKGIQGCKSLNEAFEKYVNKPADALGIKCLYSEKQANLLENYDYEPNLLWQKDLVEETKERAPKRKITWIYDPIGESGKTELAKYLYITDPNKWIITKDLGTSRDAATTIENTIKNGWNGFGIIIDLPRTAEHHDRIYTYIEEIKDGFITTQKYSGKTSVFDSPWVIVFSNWKPKYFNLSLDRWDVRKIKKDKSIIKIKTPKKRKEKKGEYFEEIFGKRSESDYSDSESEEYTG